MLIVRLNKVCKSYQEGGEDHWILKDVSFEIFKGEFLIVLGRSGSGKSTLLNLISGIDLPDHGCVEVDGNALNQMSERQRTLFRRRKIGFVFQAFNLIPTLTVMENVLLPLELNGMLDRQHFAEVESLLDQLGLIARAKTFPDMLSGGEQQRVAIARALVHQPEIILADEPTGNLDIETGLEVLKLLDDLVKLRGQTLIMATHSQEVIGMADRIITIRHNQLLSL